MSLTTYLSQLATSSKSPRKLLATGFLGVPVLILGVLLVQGIQGSALITVSVAADQGATHSLWLLPLLGLLVWGCNFLTGVLLHTRVTGRPNHLVRMLWWSGIGLELLCLAIIVSYL